MSSPNHLAGPAGLRGESEFGSRATAGRLVPPLSAVTGPDSWSAGAAQRTQVGHTLMGAPAGSAAVVHQAAPAAATIGLGPLVPEVPWRSIAPPRTVANFGLHPEASVPPDALQTSGFGTATTFTPPARGGVGGVAGSVAVVPFHRSKALSSAASQDGLMSSTRAGSTLSPRSPSPTAAISRTSGYSGLVIIGLWDGPLVTKPWEIIPDLDDAEVQSRLEVERDALVILIVTMHEGLSVEASQKRQFLEWFRDKFFLVAMRLVYLGGERFSREVARLIGEFKSCKLDGYEITESIWRMISVLLDYKAWSERWSHPEEYPGHRQKELERERKEILDRVREILGRQPDTPPRWPKEWEWRDPDSKTPSTDWPPLIILPD